MIRVNITIEGDIVVDRMLAGLEARMKDMRPIWPHVVAAFRAIVRSAFETEGASTGTRWPALKPATLADRARKGFAPGPILQRTRRLWRSLVIGGNDAVQIEAATSLELGSTVDYWVYHQSNKPRFKLPRRAPVLLTADDRHELVRPIRLYVTGHDPSGFRRAAIK